MDDDPSWSPDGSRIAFDDMPDPGPAFVVEVSGVHSFTVNVDGSNLHLIATNGATPSWGYPMLPAVTR